MRKEIAMYCLAGNQTRPLLWSHYADGHKGIALHFDGTTVPMNVARRVHYTPVYPCVPVAADRNPIENWKLVQQSLLVKDVDWKYEDEYRFLAPLTGRQHEMLAKFGARVDGLTMWTDRTILVGITLGARDIRAVLEADEKTRLRAAEDDPRLIAWVETTRALKGAFGPNYNVADLIRQGTLTAEQVFPELVLRLPPANVPIRRMNSLPDDVAITIEPRGPGGEWLLLVTTERMV